MRFHTTQVAAAAMLASGLVAGQTPAGTNPATSQHLNVQYNSTQLMANELLPQTLVATLPTISLSQTLSDTHMIMLVDLSIPPSSFNGTGPRAPGLESCRTTRLHWFQGNLTQLSNGTFVGDAAAIADYGGPMPGLNDIAHTYTFYLFTQPANFTLPAWDAGRDYNPISASTRMNFSVSAIADVAGAPVAANYMRIQNPNNNATGTASNGTCSSPATTATGLPVFTPSVVPYTGGATQQTGPGVLASVVTFGSVVVVMLL